MGHTHSPEGGSVSKQDAWWTSEGFGRKQPYSQHSHWRTQARWGSATHTIIAVNTHKFPQGTSVQRHSNQQGTAGLPQHHRDQSQFKQQQSKAASVSSIWRTFMPSACPEYSPLCFPIWLSQIMIRGTLCSDTMSWHSDLWPAGCCTGDLQLSLWFT